MVQPKTLEIDIEKDIHNSIDYYPETGLVTICSGIEDETAADFIDLALKEHKSLKNVLISSVGGSAYAAYTIGDIIKGLKLSTIAAGPTFSAGAYLYSLGHNRYCLPNTMFLIHAGSVDFGNTSFGELSFAYSFWNSKLNNMLDTIFAATKLPKAQRDKQREMVAAGKEYYFDAEESKRIGLTKEIMTFDKIIEMIEEA